MEPSASTSVLKIKCKDISIPYILNGELYEILTQEGENVTVRCCSCPTDRVYRGSVRSTGNFHMHIKRRHPELLGKLHEMKVGSLLLRRERLMKEKKLAMRGRIKKEFSGSGGDVIVDTKQVPHASVAHPIDYSRPESSELPLSLNQPQSQSQSQSPIVNETEPNIIITTAVHCDGNATMGIRPAPIFLPTVKEETPGTSSNDQAMDLSTTSRRSDTNLLSLQVSNVRWEQVLQRVESSLKDIQHEMRTRNQIETNRIFLDLAKFKYLNPGFHYHS